MRDYKPKYSTAKKQHAYKKCKISVQNFEDVVNLQKCVVYKTYYDVILVFYYMGGFLDSVSRRR